jgi:AcrR family transcriptional regulator
MTDPPGRKESANTPRVGTTADRLLTNAAQLFRRKGYAGTSTRELSALLGVQSSSLYYHMASKEELLYQLCTSTLGDVTAAFDAVLGGDDPPMVLLGRLATRYLEEALNNRDKHATMLVEIRSLSEELQAEVVRHRDRNVAAVEKVVAAAQESGDLRDDISPKYLTLGLFNLLNWTIFWFSPEGEFSSTELGEILWSLFLDGARVRSSSPRATASRRPRDLKAPHV